MPTDIRGRHIVTAADMDAMTAAERRASFDASIVTDLDQLPADYLAGPRAGAEQQDTIPPGNDPASSQG